MKGLDYVKDVVAGLNAFLDRKGYKSAREIIGLAASHLSYPTVKARRGAVAPLLAGISSIELMRKDVTA